MRDRILLALAVLIVTVGATFLWPRLFRSDFRTNLAAQLGVDAEFLHLNIPPAPNRLPGAAFVKVGSLLPLLAPLGRDQLSQGSDFKMDWTEVAARDAGSRLAGGSFSAMFASNTGDKTSVRLTSARILEAQTATLKKRLLESEDVRDQANQGRKPKVIVRSYEGTLAMKVERGDKSDAEGWSERLKLANDLQVASVEGKLKVAESNERVLLVEWNDPVVFAYEAVEATFVTGHLGMEPTDVAFTPLQESDALDVTAPTASSGGSKKN